MSSKLDYSFVYFVKLKVESAQEHEDQQNRLNFLMQQAEVFAHFVNGTSSSKSPTKKKRYVTNCKCKRKTNGNSFFICIDLELQKSRYDVRQISMRVVQKNIHVAFVLRQRQLISRARCAIINCVA